MTRLEELACKLSDDSLTETEIVELDALLSTDPQVAREFFALLDVEAVLRGERMRVELTKPILKAIEREREDRMKRGVIGEIKKHLDSGVRPAAAAAVVKPAVRPRVRPMVRARPAATRGTWVHWVNGAVAAAIMIGIGIWVVFRKPSQNDPTVGGLIKGARENKGQQEKEKVAKDQTPPVKAVNDDKIVFEEDFSNGLPGGWLCGRIETVNLPPGTKAAVRQIVKPNVNHFGIYSQDTEPKTLCDIIPSDMFHFTFKADTRDSFKVILQMVDATNPSRRGQISHDVNNDQAGWRTVDLPIANFMGANVLGEKKAMMVRYQFETTPIQDIGLMVSKIWITRPQAKDRAPP